MRASCHLMNVIDEFFFFVFFVCRISVSLRNDRRALIRVNEREHHSLDHEQMNIAGGQTYVAGQLGRKNERLT